MCSGSINAEKWSLEILRCCHGYGKPVKNNSNTDFIFNIYGQHMDDEVLQIAHSFAKDNFR